MEYVLKSCVCSDLYPSAQHQVFQVEQQSLAVFPQIRDDVVWVHLVLLLLNLVLTHRPPGEDLHPYLERPQINTHRITMRRAFFTPAGI
jgi:hypothetical protein